MVKLTCSEEEMTELHKQRRHFSVILIAQLGINTAEPESVLQIFPDRKTEKGSDDTNPGNLIKRAYPVLEKIAQEY